MFRRKLSKEEKGKRNKKAIITAVIIFGIAIFFIIAVSGGGNEKPKTTAETGSNQPTQLVVAEEQVAPVAYEIVEAEDQSLKALEGSLSAYTISELEALPTNKKMAYRVLVDPTIKAVQVKPTIDKIINEITSADDDIDEVALLIYSDKELTDGAYDVAGAIWASKGKLGNITAAIASSNDRSTYSTTITVRDDLEAYLQKRGQSEELFGYSEEERRDIFKKFVAAQTRARDEADEAYPISFENKANIQKNVDLNRELTDKYEALVLTKYDLTDDQMTKIRTEAQAEQWPLR